MGQFKQITNLNPDKGAMHFTTGILVKAPLSYYNRTDESPEGAGESSVLDNQVINQNYDAVNGEILINAVNYFSALNAKSIKNIISIKVDAAEWVNYTTENNGLIKIKGLQNISYNIYINLNLSSGSKKSKLTTFQTGVESTESGTPILLRAETWSNVTTQEITDIINSMTTQVPINQMSQGLRTRLQNIYLESLAAGVEYGAIIWNRNEAAYAEIYKGDSPTHTLLPIQPGTIRFHTHSMLIDYRPDRGVPSFSDFDKVSEINNNSIAHIVVGSKYAQVYGNTGIGVYNNSGIKLGRKAYYEASGGSSPSYTKDGFTGSALSLMIDGTFIEEVYRRLVGEGTGESSNDRNKEEGDKQVAYLLDKENNIYPLSRVGRISPNLTSFDGNKRNYKVWELDSKGNTVKPGEILMIGFLNTDYLNPCILGAYESFGGQHHLEPNVNSDFDFPNMEEDSNINDNFERRKTVSNEGSIVHRIKGKTDTPLSWQLHIEGKDANLIMTSSGDVRFSNAKNSFQMIGDKIFIGAGEYQDKADEVGINAKKVILGRSSFIKDMEKVDKDSTGNAEIKDTTPTTKFHLNLLTEAKLQPAVMGGGNIYLWRKFLELLFVAKFNGPGGVSILSQDDKQLIKTEVYDRLSKSLSQNVLVAKLPEDEVVV